MLIAVSTTKPGGLGARVSHVFEISPTITFIDSDTMSEVEVVEVKTGFFGSNAVQIVLERGTNVLITGMLNPMSYSYLVQGGVMVVPGATGLTAEEAVNRFVSGQQVQQVPMPQAPQMPPTMPYPPFMQQPQRTFPIPMMPPFDRERRREMLEYQKWIIEKHLEIMEKQKELLEKQLLRIKKLLEEMED